MLPDNIFTDEYVKQEIDFFNGKEVDSENFSIKKIKIKGRCDDYLNVQFRSEVLDSIALYMNGSIWMSLTPMEIQSLAVPIEKAKGVVGTGGLGLGYFVLKVIEKEEVKSVDIYEYNIDLINFFKKTFSDRKGFHKLTFIQCDLRDIKFDKDYDFFFNDIYLNILDQEIVPDMKLLLKQNKIKEYRFWTQEKAVYQLYDSQEVEMIDFLDLLDDEEEAFFIQFFESEYSNLRNYGYIDSSDLNDIMEALYNVHGIVDLTYSSFMHQQKENELMMENIKRLLEKNG